MNRTDARCFVIFLGKRGIPAWEKETSAGVFDVFTETKNIPKMRELYSQYLAMPEKRKIEMCKAVI